MIDVVGQLRPQITERIVGERGQMQHRVDAGKVADLDIAHIFADGRHIGDRAAKSAGSSQGAPRNHRGVKSVKSAVYQKPAQSAMERWATAAAKRGVWVIVQLVRMPPPLPPVTPSRFGSTYPRRTISSTPAMRSL